MNCLRCIQSTILHYGHFKMAKLSTINLVIFSLIILTGCNYFAAYAIARSATCRININEKYAKSSCQLGNGIYFEKLNVVKSDSTGIPIEYFVTSRFVLSNPGVDDVQKYWPDKIYFNKPNGHYRWSIEDTVDIRFARTGKERQRVSIDGSKNIEDSYAYFVFSDKTFNTCPVKFSKNSWYYVEVYDPRVSSIYLHVDGKMNFTVHRFDSGVSPI